MEKAWIRSGTPLMRDPASLPRAAFYLQCSHHLITIYSTLPILGFIPRPAKIIALLGIEKTDRPENQKAISENVIAMDIAIVLYILFF